MNVINLSGEPIGRLHSWIPHDLEAERIVFLPDACPGKSPLPTGTAVLTRQDNWRKFAVSDCGCGMRQRIMIPTGVEDCSLRTDGPFAYRDLDECLGLIKDYVEPVMRFSVIGYMGHL